MLTRRPHDHAVDPAFLFRSDPITQVVADARQGAGNKNVAVIGAGVALSQCLHEGLIDELLIFLAPVLIGDGTRLFQDPATDPIPLTRIVTAEVDRPLICDIASAQVRSLEPIGALVNPPGPDRGPSHSGIGYRSIDRVLSAVCCCL